MAKAIKKKNRRLKKAVRKTLGTLFLISAIIVAAIPVENLQAAVDPSLEVTVDAQNCSIPFVNSSETIYTTGDGQYQFAYVSPNNASSNNKVAVVLGYNGGYLNNGALTIPDTVDAYLKYSDNLGTSSGYVAVGKQGNFLYYSAEEEVLDSQGNVVYDSVPRVDGQNQPVLDESGQPIVDQVARTQIVYYPCYYEDRSNWENLAVDEFYYATGTVSGNSAVYAKTTTSDLQRIQGAEVWYIGNQYLRAGTGDQAGTWTIAGEITTSANGIFSGQSNIRTLTVGEKLSGIGNYAFYGCGGLNSIKLGNGLDTIGNYAFASCINMSNVNLELFSRVSIIGDHAFYNCQSLESFSVPISVTAIGDSAFEGCFSMTDIDLCGAGAKVSLETIGNRAFVNCESLESLTFPKTFDNKIQGAAKPIDISMFQGCTSLKYISTSNNTINFVANGTLSFSDFKASLPEEFYFEGLQYSPVHTTASANYFAFSHLGQDLYEITVDENGKKAVYRVNSSNQLVSCDLEEGITTVSIPNAIGPYRITEIDSMTFQNKCSLQKLTIPASITAIASEAFKGCHNLKDVIFTSAGNIQSIGTHAFWTQEALLHQAGCSGTLDSNPELHFVGTISAASVPFQYAMNPEEYINAGSQMRTYITFYSGWPSNLEVQYNENTDKNELIGYPTFKEISSGTKYTVSNYAYMTQEYEAAARTAVAKHLGTNTEPMTDYERQIIDGALNIVLPDGIESIQENLFANNEPNEDKVDKTITAYSLNEIAAGSFKDCTNLKSINLMSGTTTIGDYAFEGCTNLEEAYIPATVTTMGKRPFTGCNKISSVSFQGSPYFTCDNSIIYQLNGNGEKYRVVEFLNGRDTGVVDANELTQVTEIAEEAFLGTKVSSADFRKSSIIDVPENSFAETSNLYSVSLPSTCKSISADAFRDSSIQYMEVPGSVNYLDNDAFSGTTSKSGLTFYCEDGSNAYIYAVKNGIKTTSKPEERYYTVTFWDWDSTLLGTQTVAAGEDAVPPEVPGRDGYKHTGWVPSYIGVNDNLQITAQYEAINPDDLKYTVRFIDYDDTVLKTVKVAAGEDAEPPVDPVRDGYTFTGWRPAITNIQANTDIYANYDKNDSSLSQLTVRFIDYDDTVLYIQKVNYGEAAITPQNPSREGYVFTGWRPAITSITKDLDTYATYDPAGVSATTPPPGTTTAPPGTTTAPPSTTTAPPATTTTPPATTTKLYTLTVRNGSGSGSYAAGAQPIVIANDPASNQEFSSWSVDPSDTKIASKVLTATVITMPEKDVTVTASYKAKTGSSNGTTTGSGNSSSNNSGSKRPNNTTGTLSNGGTTVVIDKNGLSNTGVVSATVNGSSDNFTIKVTESTAASEAVVRALMAEYGDLSSIKYFPMDISLYDSTGTNKITDTTGLSISMTLPIPDSMITYAGNNKVAGVVNDRLDKLSPKFSTISGVACVTVTLEHFSPYVIYVDTNNLTAGVISDSTPKTGDGIHPKWFLSIGLACLSFVLFTKKDKRVLQKAKA